MISGSKGQKAVRACTIRLLNLGPAKHEESADSECFRIAGAVLQRSNSRISNEGQNTFCPSYHITDYAGVKMQSNDAQNTAINHIDGPMLVLAGPGSGKTTVITRRVKHLIEQGVNPMNILVITFTKAAAQEMQERFYALMENGMGRNVTFGTFHAVFFTILKHAYNLSASNIIKEEERYSIVKAAVSRHELDIEDEREFVGNVLGEIGRVKSDRIAIENYYSTNCPTDVFRSIYDEYMTKLKNSRKIDFEDMLCYTYELLTARKDILAAWQGKFKYILIDEFQDINKIQYDTVRLLAAPENNLFIVGDDDQSIYGFRGSKPDIMLNFEKDYRNAVRVLLDINYRSEPEIVKAAADVIRFNNKRYKKVIKTNKNGGGAVVVKQTKDFIDEYAGVCEQIKELVHNEKKSYSDIAVLYRTSAGIGSLVRRLMENGIPFQIRDKLPDMFEHWIAKDIFAYIRLAVGTANRADFISVCNKPKRYIGRDYLTDEEIDLDKLCAYYEDKQWMVERIQKLKDDLAMVAKLNPYAAVNYIRRGIGYDEYISEYAINHHIQADELFDVLNDIHESAREYNTFAEWDAAVSEYRQRVHEVPDKSVPRVTLTTMHSSKGLEFDIVFIIDANEGVCPHKKAILDEDIEEERRMFYVAMTRAKSRLYIYSACEKYNKMLDVSRFLIESGLYMPAKSKYNAKAPVSGGLTSERSGYRWNRSGTNYSG